MTVDVVIPVYKPGKKFIELMSRLAKQSMPVSKVIVMNTEEKYFSDRIGVMYYGHLVEVAKGDDLYRKPLHPYTRALLSAIPEPNPLTERTRVRIDYVPERDHDYSVEKPEMREVEPGHFVYCSTSEWEQYRRELNL